MVPPPPLLTRRFFEGWYWRVQLPNTQQSFAFNFTVEDPGQDTPVCGLGIQVGVSQRGQGVDGRDEDIWGLAGFGRSPPVAPSNNRLTHVSQSIDDDDDRPKPRT